MKDIYSLADSRNYSFTYVDRADRMRTMISGYHVEDKPEER